MWGGVIANIFIRAKYSTCLMVMTYMLYTLYVYTTLKAWLKVEIIGWSRISQSRCLPRTGFRDEYLSFS